MPMTTPLTHTCCHLLSYPIACNTRCDPARRIHVELWYGLGLWERPIPLAALQCGQCRCEFLSIQEVLEYPPAHQVYHFPAHEDRQDYGHVYRVTYWMPMPEEPTLSTTPQQAPGFPHRRTG